MKRRDWEPSQTEQLIARNMTWSFRRKKRAIRSVSSSLERRWQVWTLNLCVKHMASASKLTPPSLVVPEEKSPTLQLTTAKQQDGRRTCSSTALRGARTPQDSRVSDTPQFPATFYHLNKFPAPSDIVCILHRVGAYSGLKYWFCYEGKASLCGFVFRESPQFSYMKFYPSFKQGLKQIQEGTSPRP